MLWEIYDQGNTISTRGSECGIIVKDEQYSGLARITLEKEGHIAPWSITCGIYGSFFHTAFAFDEEEGICKYNEMKEDLVVIIHEHDTEVTYRLIVEFADTY